MNWASVRDPALTKLYVAAFLYSFAQALGVPLVPEHLKLTFGATLGFIGAVMGIYGVMQVVLRLPMGDMADRRGRKPSLLLAFAATTISAALFAFGPNAWWSIPAIALFGFAGGVFWVAANSYLFDRATDVPKATSDYTIAMSLAFLVGPPVGHLIADHWGFPAAFLLNVVASLAGLVVTWTLPETLPVAREPPVGSSYRRAWTLLKHPALALSALGTFTYTILFSTHQSFFQLYVLSLGFSITIAGLLLGGRQGTSLLVRAGLPQMLRRVGPSRVMLVGILILASVTAMIPLTTSLVGLAVLVAIAGAATGALIPANLMLVHEGAPTGERGLANGIYGTMLGLGSAFAPTLFGAAGERFGSAWTFWGAAITAVGLAAAMLLLLRRRPQAAG